MSSSQTKPFAERPRTACRRNLVGGVVALSAEPEVVAEGRGSPGGVLLGSERRRRPSRADVEGAQTSGDHSEERAARVRLEVIDSADVQSFGEGQLIVRLTAPKLCTSAESMTSRRT